MLTGTLHPSSYVVKALVADTSLKFSMAQLESLLNREPSSWTRNEASVSALRSSGRGSGCNVL
jgi:hypothetical protein